MLIRVGLKRLSLQGGHCHFRYDIQNTKTMRLNIIEQLERCQKRAVYEKIREEEESFGM